MLLCKNYKEGVIIAQLGASTTRKTHKTLIMNSPGPEPSNSLYPLKQESATAAELVSS